MTVTVASSAPTVPPRNSTQAMKVNGPCAAVYVYTHENFFLICSAATREGRTVAVMSYCDTLFGPDWDWGGSAGRPEWGVRELGRGQIVNGGFLWRVGINLGNIALQTERLFFDQDQSLLQRFCMGWIVSYIYHY